MKLGLRALALALTLAVPAFADQADPPDASDEPRAWLAQRGGAAASASAPGTTATKGGRAALVLLVVAALGGGAWWLKRRTRRIGTTAAPAVRVEVLGATRVGPKAQAVVARIGSRVVLLGVTDSSVQRLAWLDRKSFGTERAERADREESRERPARAEPSEPAPVARRYEPSEPAAPAPGFGQVLRDALGLGRRAATPEPALALAEQTRDVFVPSGERHAPTPMLRVETQAAGLVARLKELGP